MVLQPGASDLLRWRSNASTGFATDCLDVAIEHLSARFSPHRLRLAGAPDRFAAQFAAGHLGGLEMSMLRYGSEVELSVDTDDGHILVTVQTSGWSTIHSQGAQGGGGVGLIVLDSSPATVVKRFSSDSCRLNLRISRSHVDAAWTRLVGHPPHRPLVFQPFVQEDGLCRRWWAHMELLAGYLAMDAPVPQRLGDALAESVLLSLLTEFPHSASQALQAERHGVSHAARRLAKAQAVMRERYREPLCLSEIAAECAVSIRTLTQLFQDHLGVSPMRHLLEIRLQAARRLLQSAQPQWDVTRVAMDCGFPGLGRFAAAYRQRFGELPSKTRRG